jgi:hypothetical protein
MSDEPPWVIWSEQHFEWWAPGGMGYTPSLALAGRFSRTRAETIAAEANRFLAPGVIHEVAMPDSWPKKK